MKKFALISLFVTLLFNNESFATHLMGGNFEYEVLDSINRIYKIRLKLYRDCSGIPVALPKWTITYSNGTYSTVTPNFIGKKEVTPLCQPKPSTTCSNPNSLYKGTELHTYESIEQFPPGSGIVTISYRECCRNINNGPGSITNLDPNSNLDTWLGININTDLKRGNNSVILYNNPIPYICANNTFEYNFGGYDKDGDSLFYELKTPRTNVNATIMYQSGLSASKPISMAEASINLNAANGQMKFTPLNPEVSILGMVVSEYRKIKSSIGLDSIVFVGSSMIDIQLTITTACPPIKMNGINPNTLKNAIYKDNLTIKVCGNAGDTVKFDFMATCKPLPIGNNLEISLDTNYYLPLRAVNSLSHLSKKDSINLSDTIYGQFSFPILSNITGNFPIRFNVSYCDNERKITNSYTMTVQLDPKTKPIVDIYSADTFVCANGNANFGTSTKFLSGGIPIYKWYVNGALTDSGSTFQLKNIATEDTVWCKMTTNLSCSAYNVYSDTIIVKVKSNILPVIKISPEFDTSCIGADLKINYTTSGQGTNPIFYWYLNGVLDSTGSVYKKNNFNHGDMVYCKMKSNLVCALPDSVYSDTITIKRNNLLVPSLKISADKNNTCYDTEVKISPIPTNGGLLPVYYWYLNAQLVDSVNTVFKRNYKDSALVYCILKSDLKCAVPKTAYSDSIKVKIKPLVKASVTIKADTTKINIGDTARFTATNVNAGAGAIYLWFVNGKLMQNSMSKTFKTNTLQNNDTVFCFINPDTACIEFPAYISNKVAMSVLNPSGIVSNSKIDWIQIYPNPVTDKTTIELIEKLENKTRYTITNANGILLEHREMMERKHEIDMTKYPKGVYFLTIENNGKRIIEKLIKTGN